MSTKVNGEHPEMFRRLIRVLYNERVGLRWRVGTIASPDDIRLVAGSEMLLSSLSKP